MNNKTSRRQKISSLDNNSSPGSVFDLSALAISDNPGPRRSSPLIPASSEPLKSAPGAAPVDSVTAPCSSYDGDDSENDDTSTLSSLSEFSASQDELNLRLQEELKPKRSIFSRYWKHSGQAPLALVPILEKRAPAPAALLGQEPSRSTTSATSPDQLLVRSHTFRNSSLDQQERLCGADDSSTLSHRSQRRSILGRGSFQYSHTSLPAYESQSRRSRSLLSCRKVQSNSELASKDKELQSCLLSAKPAAARRRSSSCSVGFSEQVDVLYFQAPKESFAQDGWAQFFGG